MVQLINELFGRAFDNPWLRRGDDGAVLPAPGPGERLVLATDAHVVSPLFFPGGDIGSLAVHGTVNDLAVMPNSTIGQRSNDTFITGKVRASLVDAKDLSANSFKVVTERNVVYLMGRVSQREAGRATAIARGITGVSKVVRVFEYLTEEEAASLNAGKQAKPANAVNGEVPETRPAQ